MGKLGRRNRQPATGNTLKREAHAGSEAVSEAEVARFAETVERLAGELRRSAIGLDEGGAQALSARAAVMSVMFQYADAGQAFSNRLAHVRSLAIALPEKNEREVMSHG